MRKGNPEEGKLLIQGHTNRRQQSQDLALGLPEPLASPSSLGNTLSSVLYFFSALHIEYPDENCWDFITWLKRLPGPNLPFFSPFYASSLPHFSLLNALLEPFDSTYIIFSQGIVAPLSGTVFPDSHPDEPVLGQNVVITGLKIPTPGFPWWSSG